MEVKPAFHFEVEKSPDDQKGNKVTTVKCHGRVKAENVGELKGAVKSLIEQGGRIVIDLSDVHFVDSSGLGAFVALKVTAVKHGMCILEFVNMTSRILELMRMTRLDELLSSSGPKS
jgi:anti-sigma B factor antagonist